MIKHSILIGLASLILFNTDIKSSIHRPIAEIPKVQKEQSKILFAKKKNRNQGWTIYMIDPDGNNEKILIPFESGQGEYNPSVSPDGNEVLFNSYRYGGWKLAVLNLSNQKIQRITMGNNYYTNGAYSPSAEKIAYEKSDRVSNHIFIANRDGSQEKNISKVLGKADNYIPVWENENSILFYSNASGSNDIYRVSLTNLSVENLTNNSSGNDFAPAISKNGKIAFYSDRNGYLDLFVMDRDGKNQRCLTTSMQSEKNQYNYYKDRNLYWIFKASWSLDGSKIVFQNVTEESIDLFTVDSDGGNLKQLTDTPETEYTPTWGVIKSNGY